MAVNLTRRNISEIVELEAEFEKGRGTVERLVAAMAEWIGSLRCVLIHVAWFAAWITMNLISHGRYSFDPYPFPLLGTIVSCEAVFLSTVVLIGQNLSSRRDERREHLHLQINLLAEQEITKVLALQRLICNRLGIREGDTDPEIVVMSQTTEVQELAQELGNVMKEG